MSDAGFAIRCPNCMEWSEFDPHPSAVALDSAKELHEILLGLNADPEHYTHPKLLRCDHSGWECPASFEAFVCKSEAAATEFVRYPEAWSIRRVFRIRKQPDGACWGDDAGENQYFGMLFCTQPVQRQRDIELTRVLDESIVSRSIVGMTVQLDAPVTFFDARVINKRVKGSNEKKPPIYWVPIEGFSQNGGLEPVHSNPFCNLLRHDTRKVLLGNVRQTTQPANCGFYEVETETCGGRHPPCRGTKREWAQCPAFLDVLEKQDRCYGLSDLAFIKEVRESFEDGKSGIVIKGTCRAGPGFVEVAMPIVVHGHLVGVAFTGQFVATESDKPLPAVGSLMKEFGCAESHREQLERYHAILSGRVEPNPAAPDEREREVSKYRLTQAAIADKVAQLKQNVDLIQEVAETRYRQWRERTESVFKQELIGRVNNARKQTGFRNEDLVALLWEMRDFWAFRHAYLLVQPPEARRLEILATDRSVSGLPQQIPIQATIPLADQLPASWFFTYKTIPQNEWQSQIADTMNTLCQERWLSLSLESRFLLVLVPLGERVVVFAFQDRDNDGRSPLPRARNAPDVSPLARDMILQTCQEVAERLREIWRRQDLERALRSLGHTLRAPLHVIRGPLGALEAEVARVPSSTKTQARWLLDAAGRVVKAGRMGSDLARGEIDKFAIGLSLTERLAKCEKQRIDLRELVETVLDPFTFLGRAVGEGRSRQPAFLQWDKEFDRLWIRTVYADQELLRIALFNVLDNAYKYSAKQTTITTACFTEDTGRYNVVRVSNVGLPIDADEMEMVKQINYRGRHARDATLGRSEGTGMGLYLVAAIAEAHKGRLDVQCKEPRQGDPAGYRRILVEMSVPVAEDNANARIS